MGCMPLFCEQYQDRARAVMVLYSIGESEHLQELRLIMPGDESRSPVHKLLIQCSRHVRELFMVLGEAAL
jgi:hypothetical protein